MLTTGGVSERQQQRRKRAFFLRTLPDHRTSEGHVLRRIHTALVQEFNPVTPLEKLEVTRTATLGLIADITTASLLKAQQARAGGKGRRPGAVDMATLERRQVGADERYVTALNRLRELASQKRNGHALSTADAVAQQRNSSA